MPAKQARVILWSEYGLEDEIMPVRKVRAHLKYQLRNIANLDDLDALKAWLEQAPTGDSFGIDTDPNADGELFTEAVIILV